jgi:glycosyltransferase involved in cell wall biosynthesis
MRILLVPDPASPYGEDAFCRELAQRAAARGHTTALAPVPAGPREETVSRLAAQDFARDSDAVLVNSFQAAAIEASRAAGKKVAVRLIDSFADLPAEKLTLIKDSLLQADRFLVPSRHLAELVGAWDSPARTAIVPYAYDRVRANQIALVTMRASRPSGFQIVTCCKFTEACRPGLELLLSAVGSLRLDWHLSFIGQGPILPAIQERVARMLPPDRVLFTGELPHLKIMEFFRSAKAYVNVTSGDGFPAMSLYALSEGCPVVAPRSGAAPELIIDGKNGLLFDPRNPSSLSQVLVNLWTLRGLSLQLIAEGVRTVESHTWDATIAAAFAALEGMVA